MSDYEITYLADPGLDEPAKVKLDEAVDAVIAKLPGEITYSSASDAPGSRRRLHYPIHKKRVTWLRVMQAEIKPGHIAKLRAKLTKQESIMRISIIQTPRRQEVSAAVFDTMSKSKEVKPAATEKKPAVEVTMKQVEEKIEKALDEEVK